MRLLALFAAALALAACRPVDALNALTPDAGYRLESDLAFGDLARQKLDLYRPVRPASVPSPVIVFFYGGSWTGGARADYRFIGQQFAAQGYTVVIPDYRLYPDVRFPEFLKDGALAVRWVQDHVGEFGGDSARLFLMGHSAGAYNAAMLALDRRYADATGFDRRRIKGLIGLAGPYDFVLEPGVVQAVFGEAPDYAQTQPVRFVSSDAPPALLLTGSADSTVRPANSYSLAAHLRAAGRPVTLKEYAGLDHIDLILECAEAWPSKTTALADILSFLKAAAAN